MAVYPQSGEPEITEVAALNPRAATVKFTKLVLERTREEFPQEAVREVIENLIHAEYKGVVISILENGAVVRVSDKGRGIAHKDRAVEYGFSGATPEALREIRGVGAGLGIAQAAVEKVGGTLAVEDNLGGGTVTTISLPKRSTPKEQPGPPRTPAAPEVRQQRRYPDPVPRMNISERQQKVLITVLECGEVGPSTVAEQLEISVSTAYRDLSVLEEHGLVATEDSGKRSISPLGRDLADAIVSSWVG